MSLISDLDLTVNLKEFNEKFGYCALAEEAMEGDKWFYLENPDSDLRVAVIRLSEGAGDNLLPENAQKGYDSYVNIDIEALRDDCFEAPYEDGGIEIFKSNEYKTFEEQCKATLDIWFGEDAKLIPLTIE